MVKYIVYHDNICKNYTENKNGNVPHTFHDEIILSARFAIYNNNQKNRFIIEQKKWIFEVVGKIMKIGLSNSIGFFMPKL